VDGRRVVVTGLGTRTALGSSVDELWGNLLAGKSGISQIERIDVSDIATKIGSEVKDFDITDFMSRRDARRLDRSAQFFWVATQ
jgi:3-oxoacyl-[acyl-carrier-protein] synthase II